MKPVVADLTDHMPGSLAARFERLLDLYAPMTEQLDGSTMRDPSAGIITLEQFKRLLDDPCTTSARPK